MGLLPCLKVCLGLVLLGLVLEPAAAGPIRAWGPRQYHDSSFTANGAAESPLFNFTLDGEDEVGVANYFWLQAGTSPTERYITDTLVVRYYVDGDFSGLPRTEWYRALSALFSHTSDAHLWSNMTMLVLTGVLFEFT